MIDDVSGLGQTPPADSEENVLSIGSRVLWPSQVLTRTSWVLDKYPQFGYSYWLNPFFNNGMAQYEAEAVQLLSCDGSILGSDAAVASTSGEIQTKLGFVSFGDESSFFETREGPRRQPKLEWALTRTCFLAFTPAYRNYAHWLTQSVPLLFAVAGGHICQDVTLVLPIEAKHSGSFQSQYVDLLELDRERITYVEGLVSISSPCIQYIPEIDIWDPSPMVLSAAQAVAEKVPVALGQGARRIFISRLDSPHRPLLNSRAIRELAHSLGFEIVTLSGLSVTEQIALFRDADVIVGEHGAGLSNILFCRPGTLVIELFGEFYVQPHFWSLASLAGLKYGFFAGTSFDHEKFGPGSWSSPYVIGEEEFRAVLIDALG